MKAPGVESSGLQVSALGIAFGFRVWQGYDNEVLAKKKRLLQHGTPNLEGPAKRAPDWPCLNSQFTQFATLGEEAVSGLPWEGGSTQICASTRSTLRHEFDATFQALSRPKRRRASVYQEPCNIKSKLVPSVYDTVCPHPPCAERHSGTM